jgi:uncharacterized protein (DUF697 family)
VLLAAGGQNFITFSIHGAGLAVTAVVFVAWAIALVLK